MGKFELECCILVIWQGKIKGKWNIGASHQVAVGWVRGNYIRGNCMVENRAASTVGDRRGWQYFGVAMSKGRLLKYTDRDTHTQTYTHMNIFMHICMQMLLFFHDLLLRQYQLL